MNENLKKSGLDLPRVLGLFSFFSLFLVLFLTISDGATALDKTFPNDCPGSAQACADQICAAGVGTLHIAAGRYTLGPGVGSHGQIFNNNLIVNDCGNFELKGAGVDSTTLDATNSRFATVPGLGRILAPFIVLGEFPLTISFPLATIKISDLTIEAGSTFGFAAVAFAGIGMGSEAHDLKIVGFPGFSVSSPTEDLQIYDNFLEGEGITLTSGAGIDVDANCNLFRVPGGSCFPPVNLHSNLKIENNHILNYRFGIVADHVVDSKIEGNVIENCNQIGRAHV